LNLFALRHCHRKDDNNSRSALFLIGRGSFSSMRMRDSVNKGEAESVAA